MPNSLLSRLHCHNMKKNSLSNKLTRMARWMHIGLLAICVCLIEAFAFDANAQEDARESYLLFEIKELAIEDMLAQEAIMTIASNAFEEGAGELGFRGVLVAAPEALERRVSIKLNDVPLVFAMHSMAELVLGRLIIDNGSLLIVSDLALEKQLVPVELPLTTSVMNELGIAMNQSPEGVKEAIRKRGIQFSDDSRVVLNWNKRVGLVVLRNEEALLLEAVIKLAERRGEGAMGSPIGSK